MSPSPVVDQKTRERIGEIAVRAVDAVDYLNAGTAEFLRDTQGNFYFIEINSRLQVEHPVTELVTGLDLVKLPIGIAQGEEIPFKQQDLKMNGCAIECRINAEDPFYEFAPSTGIVPNCNIPYGPGIRVDTYLYPSCNVSGYYDSLVAKLLAWGRNFDESRIRMKNALDEFMIEGINTTIPLYKTIMNDPNFINGELSTDYLERFKILNKMNEDAKGAAKKSAKAAVAAVLLQSEFVRKSAAIQQSSVAKSKWKMMSG
jgi:acetyl-CoA/propionyl-CoA carboxylase